LNATAPTSPISTHWDVGVALVEKPLTGSSFVGVVRALLEPEPQPPN
jgi:hypothetical protein